ncbi:MAG: [FeFe] hydrogenase, group A [Deltaproteobacteria bacterium]|jgi:iron-only hydrogenase group A|nr:[FeFe] hydrogenase, group A [Deltaproteobacteria bacterium]
MISVKINHKTVKTTPEKTILEVLRKEGIDIPTLCHMQGFPPTGSCRMCVVEVKDFPGLVPSCSYPVRAGMEIQTHSNRVLEARRTILELLLATHPDDCLYCGKKEDCYLLELSSRMNVDRRPYRAVKKEMKRDIASNSIIRDNAKCILCGKCVRICEEVQQVGAIDFVNRGADTCVASAFEDSINLSTCIGCGQCIMVCPTGALQEKSYLNEVMEALNNPAKTVVVQNAPAVSVTIAQELDLDSQVEPQAVLTGILKKMGFDYVFETGFSADLTIMEESSELIERLQQGGKLPMFTSCSPGWVDYVEKFHPELRDYLSSCKSPQQMLGSLVKTFWAESQKINHDDIFHVAIMPCTAKKSEAERSDLLTGGNKDIDAVLTTREFLKLIKLHGIEVEKIESSPADTLLGKHSSAGKLFAASGGVMEAALRTAHYLITGKNMEEPEISTLRNLREHKETELKVGNYDLKVAVVYGLGAANKLLEEIKRGEEKYDFVEVMTCPGGCVGGGGQPFGADQEKIRERMEALYKIDSRQKVRFSHENESIKNIYAEFLGKPLGKKSHELLHVRRTNQ